MRVELFGYSQLAHVWQIYTGLGLLSLSGAIDLRVRPPSDGPGLASLAGRTPQDLMGVAVVLDGSCKVFFDMRDDGGLAEAVVAESDIYFKRSYREADIPQRWHAKVRPWGLNTEVHLDARDWARLPPQSRPPRPAWPRRLMHRWNAAVPIPALAVDRSAFCLPTDAMLRSDPPVELPPRVLFMTRVWDPDDNGGWTLPPQQRAQWLTMNQMRELIILKLRAELGPAFTGGLERSDYALRQHAAAVLDDRTLSKKLHYLRTLRQHPICITSIGLHHSNGWKLAEYLAMSRAIVTERLHYHVPYGLAAGTHYLDYEDPQTCVDRVLQLVGDAALRSRLMDAAQAWYAEYGAPDRLMFHALAASGMSFGNGATSGPALRGPMLSVSGRGAAAQESHDAACPTPTRSSPEACSTRRT